MEAAVLPLVGTEAGRVELSLGAGGDRTVELDRAAEAVALAALEKLAVAGERFSVLSEEMGLRAFGSPFPLVLIDPLDGSLNAKLGVPVFGLMLALSEAPTLADVSVGYVRDLATGQSWHALRGGGAWQEAAPLQRLPGWESGQFRVLGLETSPRTLLDTAPLVRNSSKVRLLGSMALSIVLTATGAFDVFCSAFQARAFDMAASLLILGEAGGLATDVEGRPVNRLPLDLTSRTTLLCAREAQAHRRALTLMTER